MSGAENRYRGIRSDETRGVDQRPLGGETISIDRRSETVCSDGIQAASFAAGTSGSNPFGRRLEGNSER